jgi:hypothetical protein
VHARELRVGINERRPGRLWLEQRDRLGRERDLATLAQAQGNARVELQRSCCRFLVAAGTEGGKRLLERLSGLAAAAGLEGSVRPADKEVGPLGSVGRRELERPGEPRLGLGGIETERPLAGEREEAPSRRGELLGLLRIAGRLGELERLQVVVGEHLGHVLDPLARLALDPGCRGTVATCPLRPRDLAVGNVAHEQVPERVLALPFHRARPGRADELLAGKLMQRQLEFALVPVADLGQRAHPKDLAEHGRVLEQALAVRRERVQAGGDQCLQALGQRRLGEDVSPVIEGAVCEQSHELLRIEWVAARAFEDRLLELPAEVSAGSEVRDELGRLLVRER